MCQWGGPPQHSDIVKSADDTEVAIWDCPLFFVGSDLRLLNKPVSVFPYLYSKRRSDPTKNNGTKRTIPDCYFSVIGRFYNVAVTGTRLVLPVLVHKDTQIIIGPGRPRDSGRPPATSAEPPTSTGLRPDGGDVRGAPAGRRRRQVS